MKETPMQITLPGVPKAKQGRETDPKWEWTEASVWTERMLATLEGGIKGGKWYSLIDKVWKKEDVNRTLTGWIGYFKHSHWTTFKPLDKWVRMRLRTIQRKRHKGKGRARGKDHQRWPIAYFADLGLISLALARRKAAKSG